MLIDSSTPSPDAEPCGRPPPPFQSPLSAYSLTVPRIGWPIDLFAKTATTAPASHIPTATILFTAAGGGHVNPLVAMIALAAVMLPKRLSYAPQVSVSVSRWV